MTIFWTSDKKGKTIRTLFFFMSIYLIITELLVDYLAMTWYPIEYLKVSGSSGLADLTVKNMLKVSSLISIENLEANDFYNAQLLDLSKKRKLAQSLFYVLKN